MLGNLKLLKEDMKNKGWTICTFTFRYKSINYIVLVKRFVGGEKRIDRYALVKLEFMKEANLDDSLSMEANSRKLIIDAETLRKYFGIEYANNLGCILQQFTKRLGGCIPTEIKLQPSILEKQAMLRSLSKSDSEDPNKIYCIGVKRNPEGKNRSEFNADKTKLLRKKLFEYYKGDCSISFCYSADSTKENDDTTILKNFSNH